VLFQGSKKERENAVAYLAINAVATTDKNGKVTKYFT
jgi:hypothetical protein